MSAASTRPPLLFGQEFEGVNGFHLAVYRRYRELLASLDPLLAAALSAFKDNDMRLVRIYERCFRQRLEGIQRWMDLTRDVLQVPDIDAVMRATREEIERDRMIRETFDLLRTAMRRAEEAAARASAAEAAAAAASRDENDGATQQVGDPHASAADPGPSSASDKDFLQNELRSAADAEHAPDVRTAPSAAASRPHPAGAAPRVAPSRPPLAATIVQNEIRRPPRLQMRGAGSWSEPVLLPPLTIMGRDVYPRELDPRLGDRLFE